MSAIDRFLQGNARFADDFSNGGLSSPPAQRIAVVTCMDARLHVAALLGLEAGDAHVIRNAGGVVTDDVLRSLMISQRMLGTREIMLIHHTNCGMQGLKEDELADTVERETGVRPPFAIGAFSDLDDDVRRSMTRIEESPFIPHTEVVRGFVYEVESGRLREVERP